MQQTRKTIDLNSDVGESFGNYTLGMDDEVIPLISSANIACGFHAGDPLVMRRTVQRALQSGVAPGAHPGFPDLMGFGRRNMDATADEIRDYVIYQVGALSAFVRAEGGKLQHVKPHGALYTMAVGSPWIWQTVAEAMATVDSDLILFVLGGRNRDDLKAMGRRVGIRVACEFFADRAYNIDGSLVSRRETGAVIKDHETAAARVLKMVTEGRVVCLNGEEISLSGDTVCVHGDNPSALALVRQIRTTLEAAGVAIRPVGTFLED
jgi:UPF0271 protein